MVLLVFFSLFFFFFFFFSSGFHCLGIYFIRVIQSDLHTVVFNDRFHFSLPSTFPV